MARKVEFTFDPFELVGEDKEGLSPAEVKQVMNDVGDFVLTSVLDDTANQVSAVYGDKWDALSPDYKKVKKAKGGKPVANLELEGDMLSALNIVKRSNSLTLSVRGDQADKADGHNNHSGESKLPLRRFVPSEADGDTFSPKIMKGIENIIQNVKDSADKKAEPDPDQETKLSVLQELVDQGLKITLKGTNE